MVWRYVKKASLGIAVLLLIGVSGWVHFSRRNGGQVLSVQSQSMAPSLQKGDLVNVKRVPASQLQVGDVITFINPTDRTTTITHRIVNVLDSHTGSAFVTQGDANESSDVPIDAQAVVGRVDSVLPNAGYAIDFLRTIPGLILAIYVPALIMVGTELKRLTIYYKKIKPYLMPTNEPNWRAQASPRQKLWGITKLSLFLVSISSLAMIPAWAALTTSASLTGNTISSVTTTPPNCNGNNNNNVVINNTTNQTATSGNASNSNNTNGGSATSGNASNSNTININVNINNC